VAGTVVTTTELGAGGAKFEATGVGLAGAGSTTTFPPPQDRSNASAALPTGINIVDSFIILSSYLLEEGRKRAVSCLII
jgi:hypothetical protein